MSKVLPLLFFEVQAYSTMLYNTIIYKSNYTFAMQSGSSHNNFHCFTLLFSHFSHFLDVPHSLKPLLYRPDKVWAWQTKKKKNDRFYLSTANRTAKESIKKVYASPTRWLEFLPPTSQPARYSSNVYLLHARWSYGWNASPISNVRRKYSGLER